MQHAPDIFQTVMLQSVSRENEVIAPGEAFFNDIDLLEFRSQACVRERLHMGRQQCAITLNHRLDHVKTEVRKVGLPLSQLFEERELPCHSAAGCVHEFPHTE